MLLREIADLSRRVQTEWDKVDDTVSRILNLNRTDMRVLDILERVGPLTAGRLAELASLSTGAVTAVIDRLEAVGYVHRRRDPEDRRRVIVDIDREQVARYAWIYEWVGEEAVRRLQGMSDADLRVVRDFLGIARDLSADHAAWLRERVGSQAD